MLLLVSFLTILPSISPHISARWAGNDTLIDNDLGPYVNYDVDYDYTSGNIYLGCSVDSGYALGSREGWMAYYSQDHGHYWTGLIGGISSSNYDHINVDMTATRSDTVYLLSHYEFKSSGTHFMRLHKMYNTGSGWNRDEIWSTYSTTEIRSPKIVRDDFDPFYLYLAYIIHSNSTKDTLRMIRSTDGGYSWTDTLHNTSDNIYYGCDIAVAGSTIRLMGHYYLTTGEGITLLEYPDRGIGSYSGTIITLNSDTVNKKIENPCVGVTTTSPDSNQLVYAFFTQRDSATGNWNLLYRYKSNNTWSSTNPETLHKGSISPIVSDVRGRQWGESEFIDIVHTDNQMGTYPTFTNYWRSTGETSPEDWSDSIIVSSGFYWSYPKITYSPGSGVESGAALYNNRSGEIWFDASWFSGVEEIEDIKNKNENYIILSTQSIKFNTSAIDIYDLSGRLVKNLNSRIWNLTDNRGLKVDPGIYFVNKRETGEQKKVIILK